MFSQNLTSPSSWAFCFSRLSVDSEKLEFRLLSHFFERYDVLLTREHQSSEAGDATVSVLHVSMAASGCAICETVSNTKLTR